MKKCFTYLFIYFLFIQTIFAQSEKTFVKSLTAQASEVVIDLKGITQVNEWDEKFIRVTTTVKLTNFNEEILKRLVSVGRYALVVSSKDNAMNIAIPKLETDVSIKGKMLIEVMTYEINVPKGMTFEIIKSESQVSSN